MGESDDLRADLRVAWNRRLYLWWRAYNHEFLSGALREPLIRLASGRRVLGQWDGERRVLSISEIHIQTDPWLEVMDTLRHEMAHQYVQEVLGAVREDPHGPAFREACRRLRCYPSARARSAEVGRTLPPGEDDRILRRLRKILSLAESPNRHEAQAAVEKARYLLARYSIDLVELDREREFGTRCLGRVKGRHMAHELWMASILSDFFFVEVIWAESYDPPRDRPGSVLQVFGTRAHLEMAEYVHSYLSQAMDRLWVAYRRDRGLTSNRPRQRFLAGVMEGLHRKLGEQARDLGERWGLVWKGDPRLRRYVRHLNPRVETRSWGGTRSDRAHRDGIRRGRRVRISRPLDRPAKGVAGRLLP